MKVVVTLPAGQWGWTRTLSDDLLIPNIGEDLALPGGETYSIRHVIHHPWGDGDDPEPFIYVVLNATSAVSGEDPPPQPPE